MLCINLLDDRVQEMRICLSIVSLNHRQIRSLDRVALLNQVTSRQDLSLDSSSGIILKNRSSLFIDIIIIYVGFLLFYSILFCVCMYVCMYV